MKTSAPPVRPTPAARRRALRQTATGLAFLAPNILGFMTFTLLPRLRLWVGAVSRLMSAEEQEEFFPEFIVDAVAMAELSARFAAYASAISSRILNPNEVRAMENRPPYVGGERFENPNTTSGSAESLVTRNSSEAAA